jgi:hypothetical protein
MDNGKHRSIEQQPADLRAIQDRKRQTLRRD